MRFGNLDSATLQRLQGVVVLLPMGFLLVVSQVTAQWLLLLIALLMSHELANILRLRTASRALVVFSFIMFSMPSMLLRQIEHIPLLHPAVLQLTLVGASLLVVLASNRTLVAGIFFSSTALTLILLQLFLAVDGWHLILVGLVLVVTCCDVAAYFGGRRFGGKRLAPGISPNKTWSGAACGAAAGTTVFALLVLIFWPNAQLIPAVGAGIIVSVAAQLGDLLESALKRRLEVKDSGTLLPGHGGFLDRFDGYVLAAPALILLLPAL